MGPVLFAWLLVSAAQLPPPRTLDALDRAAGWVSLCESPASVELPAGWSMAEGSVRRAAGANDYLSLGPVLRHFELEFDWRDNFEAEADFRHGRIVMREDGSALALLAGERLDHAREGGLPTFRAGPFELTPAQKQPGWHIALAPGDSALELRAIRLRDLSRLPGDEVALFDGRTLAGWRALGDAKYTVENGELVGEVGGGGQSFLATTREFGDFIFEVELRNELPGNSGIQIRSHENDKGRLFGYQIEIDPSKRAWSGGLYDEARRGWLDDLSDDPLARAAFQSGQWNRYRIECVGPSIRAWVNDVPTADCLDVADLSGVIGLQVHSGRDTKMRWRNFRLRDLGRSKWKGPGEWRVPFVFGLAHPQELFERRQQAVFSGGPTAADWLLLSRSGGDLRLAVAHRSLDPGDPTGTNDAISESLELDGADWTCRVPLPPHRVDAESGSGLAASREVLVLCHPPRVAIVIDGKRLGDLEIKTAIRQRDMRIEALLALGVRCEVTGYESLERD
ncbi:MAG: DUF1080 domain-containing protein [Planctomycetes bacterium]|nr:DUF1080 domain-containing protein [Planctomycetota bacterium]